jgi:hypothetical protein
MDLAWEPVLNLAVSIAEKPGPARLRYFFSRLETQRWLERLGGRCSCRSRVATVPSR